MRKPITMRFDPDLLARARIQAARENRTLTNFIETVVRQRVSESWSSMDRSDTRTVRPGSVAAPAERDA